MGIFSSIKKLFFATESVAKSSVEQASDYAKEKAEDIGEVASDFVEKSTDFVKEKTSGLRDSLGEIADTTEESYKDVKEKTSTYTSDPIEKIADRSCELYEGAKEKISDIKDNIGEKLDQLADSPIVEKAADVSEHVGDKVLDAGEDFMEGAKSASAKLGEKLDVAKEHLLEKANDAADHIVEKYNELADIAEEDARIEASKPKKDFSDKDLDTGDSLLDGTDDFFSKAARYADGDYGAVREGKLYIDDVRVDTEKSPIKAAGFSDNDGDGNEIIDDAIISDED